MKDPRWFYLYSSPPVKPEPAFNKTCLVKLAAIVVGSPETVMLCVEPPPSLHPLNTNR